MQPRNMSMSGVVDLAAVKAAGEAKAKAEQARAEAARQGGGGAASPADLVIDVDEAGSSAMSCSAPPRCPSSSTSGPSGASRASS